MKAIVEKRTEGINTGVFSIFKDILFKSMGYSQQQFSTSCCVFGERTQNNGYLRGRGLRTSWASPVITPIFCRSPKRSLHHSAAIFLLVQHTEGASRIVMRYAME